MNRISYRLLVALGAWLAISDPSLAAAVTVPALRDTTIYQNAVHNSGGGAAGLFVGSTGQGSPRRGLIAFDVAATVPAGATISTAELTMTLGSASSSSDSTIGLHTLLAAWGEGTAGSSNLQVGGAGGGFAAMDGDATWNARFHSAATPTLWAAAGGDFAVAASATATVGSTLDASHVWSSTGLIADVQNWLDNPTSNFGWALINADEASNRTVKVFYSSEATLNAAGGMLDAMLRPTLQITYVVPEPGSLSMLLAGSVASLQARRRRSPKRPAAGSFKR